MTEKDYFNTGYSNPRSQIYISKDWAGMSHQYNMSDLIIFLKSKFDQNIWDQDSDNAPIFNEEVLNDSMESVVLLLKQFGLVLKIRKSTQEKYDFLDRDGAKFFTSYGEKALVLESIRRLKFKHLRFPNIYYARDLRNTMQTKDNIFARGFMVVEYIQSSGDDCKIELENLLDGIGVNMNNESIDRADKIRVILKQFRGEKWGGIDFGEIVADLLELRLFLDVHHPHIKLDSVYNDNLMMTKNGVYYVDPII